MHSDNLQDRNSDNHHKVQEYCEGLASPRNMRETWRTGSDTAGPLYDDKRWFLGNGDRPQIPGRADNRLCDEN